MFCFLFFSEFIVKGFSADVHMWKTMSVHTDHQYAVVSMPGQYVALMSQT